ncbi:MAG: hypothetical protein FWC39_05095 [Bacteroidetes bacterium]|nr:hypothetical protein [Bacteroidota bacterium]
MAAISLKIDDFIFAETENILSKTKQARNRYINEALNYYNKMQKRLFLEKILRKESKAVQESSMEVVKEFEKIDNYDL